MSFSQEEEPAAAEIPQPGGPPAMEAQIHRRIPSAPEIEPAPEPQPIPG